MKKNTATSIHYSLLFILIFLVVFVKLGGFHMRWWDESVFAVNTYEMIQNGKWFSFYFEGVPDLFNTKPPLTSWLQILFIKILGYNELALRLPSAIAAALSIILLFRFLAKRFDYLWAWISSLILLTSYGFIHFHSARTGDVDSLLTLFVLLANLHFIKYVLSPSKKDILFFFLFITLGFAIKLYVALLFVPAYIFILLYKRLFKQFTLNWAFLGGILFSLLSIGSLLYFRELDTPGYLHEIIFKEAGRLTSEIDNHKQATFFYLENLINVRFSTWFIFFIFGVILSFYHVKHEKKDILMMFLSFIISFLTIIMVSVTKLEWYDMPLFPYLAVFAAYPIYKLLQSIEPHKKSLSEVAKYALLALLFFYPYVTMYNKTQGNTIIHGEMQLEANEIYLFRKIKNKQDLNNIKVYHNNWKGSLLFYKYKLKEMNQDITLITNLSDVNKNDRILISNEALKLQLTQNFETTITENIMSAQLFLIHKKKTSNTTTE